MFSLCTGDFLGLRHVAAGASCLRHGGVRATIVGTSQAFDCLNGALVSAFVRSGVLGRHRAQRGRDA
jgi:hypothetical protein